MANEKNNENGINRAAFWISSVFLTLTVIASVFFADGGEIRYIFTSAKSDDKMTVILDAGHGGLTNTIH